MSQRIDFLQPRLVGKRFDDHTIPLEVLADLSALEELITETAKWLYLNDHHGRQRIPRGFMDGISIKLSDITDGSAVPKLVLVVAASLAGLFPSENQRYFEAARAHLIGAVDAAQYGQVISVHLPDHLLGYFERIGRSLVNDEYMEFDPGNHEHPARLDKETRRTLILASAKTQNYSEEIELRGTVPEADQKQESFTLVLDDGQKLSAPLDSVNRANVLSAFNGYRDEQRLSLKGIGIFNRNNKLLRLETVEHTQLVDALDIGTRLAELAQLRPGWLDGKGQALDREGLRWLEEAFDASYDASLPLPYLYPTAEGGVQAEWTIAAWEISLTVDLLNKQAEYQAVETTVGETLEKTLDLNSAEAWRVLNADLAGFTGASA